MDLAAAFTHDIKAAIALGKEVAMITMDVRGAFDALLTRRLPVWMTAQGWPLPLLRLVHGFLIDRRLECGWKNQLHLFMELSAVPPRGSR